MAASTGRHGIGSRSFLRKDGVSSAYPTGDIKADKILLGLYTLPYVTRMWSGGVTATGFAVNFDVVGTDPATDAETVGLVVSTSPDLSAPAYVSPDVPPTVTYGLNGAYFTGTFTAIGLAADTLYYYGAKINGEVKTASIGRVRTAPTQGTAKSFSFVIGSCTHNSFYYGNPYAPVAAMNPAFIVHCGDIAYDDIDIDSVPRVRDSNTRQWRSAAGVQAMLLAAPIVYMPDDHDFGPNDAHWDALTSTLVPHEQLGINTRMVVRETTPRYPDWNAMVLSQAWTWGRVRFIMPDLRSQRRHEVGTPTFFGDGTNPPTGYDHKAAVFAAIDQAEADGMKMLVFISTSTWAPGSIWDSWDSLNSAEQTELADKFRDCAVQVMLICGDTHQGVADDGTNTDRSSTQDTKLPFFVSSGWNINIPSNLITSSSWNGADGNVTGEIRNKTLFLKVSVDDGGGDAISWEAEFFGAPLSGGSATSLAVFRSDDAAVEVGFATASALKVESGNDATMSVRKSWLGPVAGCSATYTWASGPTGTVTFGPNRTTASIPRPYTDGTPDTVTLSNPVGCALGSIVSRGLEWFTPEAETSAWLAQVSERPNDEILYAFNSFIAGLKADGVWSKIHKLYWLGAHTQQASLLEIKSPGSGTLTVEGIVTYTRLNGWRGAGTNNATINAINTGYAIPSGSQNSLAMFVRCLDGATGVGEMGNEKYYICPRSGVANDFRTRHAFASSDSFPTAQATPGSFSISRTGSASYKKYIDGLPVETVTRTSSVPDSLPIWLCGAVGTTGVNQSGVRRVAMAMISDGLSDAEVLAFYDRETAFLQAVGTIS